MKTLLLSSLILALGAAPGAQHWVASSTTAISITGDVTFTPHNMRFYDGKSISLAYFRTTNGAKFYHVSGTNPSLLRDNTLCGTILPITLRVTRAGNDISATFYDRSGPCAIFNYTVLVHYS